MLSSWAVETLSTDDIGMTAQMLVYAGLCMSAGCFCMKGSSSNDHNECDRRSQ